MLEHNLTDHSQSLETINPGWHVFIHEDTEKFSGKSSIQTYHSLIHFLNNKREQNAKIWTS